MTKKVLIILLVLFSCGVVSATSAGDFFRQLVLNPNFQIFKAHFFGGDVGIKGGYQPGVEASYHEGLYTRWDRYYFDATLQHSQDLGKVAKIDFSLAPSVKHDLEVQFARQFLSKKNAYLATPYFVDHIPVTADDAIKKLNIGDFVTIKAELNLMVTANFLKNLGFVGNFSITGSDYFMISGQFYILVLRLPKDKIRLKLIAVRQKENGGSINIGIINDLQIFRVSWLNGGLTQVLDLNPIKLSYNKGVTNLFMVDYILDLKHIEVARAYNKVLRKATAIENGILVNPLQDREKLKNHLIMDILPIDRLAEADVGVATDQKRVDRSFKGSIDDDYRSKQLRLGISLAQALMKDDYSESKISEMNLQGDETKYQMDSFQKRYEGGFLFEFFNVRKDMRMNGLYQVDSQTQKLKSDDWMVSLERRDADFSISKFQRIQRDLQRVIPLSLYNQIDFSSWKIGIDPTKQNVATRYQATLHAAAILSIPPLSREEIFHRYIEYLKQVPSADLYHRQIVPDRFSTDPDLYVRYFGFDVDRIAKKLEKVFSSVTSDAEKQKTLMTLRQSNLFMESGMRFMMELLPQEKLPDLVHFHFEMESDFNTKVVFAFGNQKPSQLFEKVLYLQKLLGGDGIDLRLESENLKLAESLSLAGPNPSVK